MITVQDLSPSHEMMTGEGKDLVLDFLGMGEQKDKYKCVFVRLTPDRERFLSVWGCGDLPWMKSPLVQLHVSWTG